MDTTYLRKQYNTWQVEVEIPAKLRAAAKAQYGVSRAFTKTLGTHSLAEANRTKHAHVAEFKHRIELLKKGQADPIAEVRALALKLREQTLAAKNIDSLTQVESQALDAIDDYIAQEHGDAMAGRFLKVARNEAKFIKDHYEGWAERGGGTTGTITMRKQKVSHFLEWAGQDATFDDINRKRAAEYVDYLHVTRGLAYNTVGGYIAQLDSLWAWLINRGETEANPWTGQEIAGTTKRGVKTVRQQWDDEKLVALMTGSMARSEYVPDPVHDLVRLGAVTGGRLDEFCALKVTEVLKRDDGLWLDITAGKTEAAVREIPVHATVSAMLQRRKQASTDGFLFPGLTPGGPDGKRSWYVSKAFGRYCDALGFSDKALTFHSLRNTFNECAEAAAQDGQVIPSTVKLLVGHARSDITFGGYSKGVRVELRTALNAIIAKYSEPVLRCLRGE